LDGVPTRRYAPDGARGRGAARRPVAVYLHGGGFVFGGLESHDDICAEICAATGLAVVSVAYRLAPEHRHPAQHHDALRVARALAGEGPIVMVGDSAGGALAAAVSDALGRAGGVIGQALVYPALARARAGGAFVRHRAAPMLTARDVAFYDALRFGGAPPLGDAAAHPLEARRFAHLPPTLALAAACDPLADDPPAYVAALRAAGVAARCRVEPGLVHGHLRARHMSAKARASFAGLLAGIDALAGG
jgi:acetyl esterase